MNQSRKVTEGALMISIFAILLFISIFVPVISLFALIVTPLPFVIFAARHGLKPAALVVAGALVISTFVVPQVSLPFSFAAGIGGVLIGHSIFKEARPYEAVLKGTAGFAVAAVVVMAAAQLLFQVNVLNLLEQAISESAKGSMSMLQGTGATDDQIKLIQGQADLIKDLIPASMIILSGFYSLFVTWLSFKFLNRLDRKRLVFPPFRNLQLPAGVVWLYLAAIIFALLTAESKTTSGLIAANVLVLFELLVVLQGISFLFNFSWKKKIAKVWPIIITIVALLFPPILYLVRFIGVLDIGLRLRDRVVPKE